jgi:hypothetical protein
MAAFKQFLLSLQFNTKNIGIADRLQAQGQLGRAGIAAVNADDWVGVNGVVIPAPAVNAASNADDWVGIDGVVIPAPAAPAAPRRPKTASTRPSMLVLGATSEYKYDEGAQEMVWVGRP